MRALLPFSFGDAICLDHFSQIDLVIKNWSFSLETSHVFLVLTFKEKLHNKYIRYNLTLIMCTEIEFSFMNWCDSLYNSAESHKAACPCWYLTDEWKGQV